MEQLEDKADTVEQNVVLRYGKMGPRCKYPRDASGSERKGSIWREDWLLGVLHGQKVLWSRVLSILAKVVIADHRNHVTWPGSACPGTNGRTRNPETSVGESAGPGLGRVRA